MTRSWRRATRTWPRSVSRTRRRSSTWGRNSSRLAVCWGAWVSNPHCTPVSEVFRGFSVFRNRKGGKHLVVEVKFVHFEEKHSREKCYSFYTLKLGSAFLNPGNNICGYFIKCPKHFVEHIFDTDKLKKTKVKANMLVFLLLDTRLLRWWYHSA